MNKIFYLFLISLILSSCKNTASVARASKQEKTSDFQLTKQLRSINDQGAIAGFSVGVVSDKGILYEHGFGVKDLDNKKYTSQTIQNIGSISKTLIAISLMKAVELGKLNLNDPINLYLPYKIINPYHPEIPILVKHLAYHTSTLQDLDEVYGKSYVLKKEKSAENEFVPDYFNPKTSKISILEFMQNSLISTGKWYSQKTFSSSKPGEVYEYSNIAATLCALVIESATRQDYRDFTRDYIIKPLKMKSSGWSSEDTDDKLRSQLFANRPQKIADYELITFADGGFLTSTQDLSSYLIELIKGFHGEGILLTTKSYDQIFQKHQFSQDGKNHEVGMFMEFRDGFLGLKNEMIGHNGSDPGVFTAMYFNPTTKIGKIIFVNTDTDEDEKVWPEIKEIWKNLSEYKQQINSTQ